MAPLSIEAHNVKELLRKKSEELGFLKLSVANYAKLDSELKNYIHWINSGYHATMGWMERNIDKREDISLILPNVKSVITLAYSYFTGNIYPENPEANEGLISRYAWGYDYHEVLKEKVNLIEFELKNLFPEAETKFYIDTGPVLEKQWAVLSGLGWQGKNSLVINKDFGSYFFICIIFTNIELPADETVKDYCGTCNKCINACPTDAIIADKVIDSNKCISYWTIEAKPEKTIPDDIANNSENRIYGCDICQEVCPWNKNKPKLSPEAAFQTRFKHGIIEREFIENLEQEDFSRLFKGTPVKRLKLAGIKRNATTILK